MPQLEQIEAIEKRLWKAADTLRANSNYASNEYFLPVMELVFLRHAYSRFLAVRESIAFGLPTRGGRARPLAKEDFSQRGAIFLQPKAQVDHLVSLPNSQDRAKAIIEAMENVYGEVFCRIYEYFLTPGRYVGVAPVEEDETSTLRRPCGRFMWSWKTSTPRLCAWRRPSRRS